METNIKIFESPTFGSVRTISDENGEPLFCLADGCKAVELTNTTAVKKRLDAEDVQLVDLHALNSNNEQIVGNSMANAPKADYYDQVLTAESTYTTTQIAKEFGMSGKRLNEVLHAMGVQYKVNEQWVLYADYCGKGYTKTLTFTYSDADGQLHSRQSMAWTEKGREFIHKLMKETKSRKYGK